MTCEQLYELLHEALEVRADGALIRRKTSGNAVAGSRAGYIHMPSGYERFTVSGVRMLSHRAVFLMVNGFLPDEVDHIDGDRTNNRPENLRPATRRQNCWNASISKVNSSGFKGVSFSKRLGKWIAQIRRYGQQTHLGLFDDPGEAARAYDAAAADVCGEYAKTNAAMGLL